MEISIGTFNLNNLFSRYNFRAEIDAIRDNDTEIEDDIHYEFVKNDFFKIRKYKGRLVRSKDSKQIRKIVNRIKAINVDILAVQEVEDIDTLRAFNREYLKKMYLYVGLIEGNDPRLIDIGILSKYPINSMTSWQHTVHPDDPEVQVFGRDLLEVEIYDKTRTKKLFSIFNNHLKSHYKDYRKDPEIAKRENNKRRARQAEIIMKIVKQRTRPNSSFIILGDMNDPPNSDYLKSFVEDKSLKLTNALKNPQETSLTKRNKKLPKETAWTYRYKESGKPAEYMLYDQIWISPALSKKQIGAWIDRRTTLGGDGSDHDPAWIKLMLS